MLRLHPAARPIPQGRAQRPIDEQPIDGCGEADRITLRHEKAVLAVRDHRRDAAGGRGDDRRARGQRFQDDVGQPVDVAGVVADRGHDGDVGRRQHLRHGLVREQPGEAHVIGHPEGRGPRAELSLEVAAPGQHHLHLRVPVDQRRHGVDQVLEPLFLHEAPDRDHQRRVRRDAEQGPAAGPRLVVAREALGVDAVGDHRRSRRIRAQADRAITQVGAAGGDPAGPGEGAPRHRAGHRVALGDEDVRPVQADDQRPPGCRERRHGAAGDDPVPVHDGRADLLHHPPRRGDAGQQAERRRRPGRPLQRDVGLQAFGVAEHVERRMGRVVERVQGDAAALERARQLRVPRQHDVDGVAAGGEAARDRLHERAVDVARETRVGRRDHYDGFGHRSGQSGARDVNFQLPTTNFQGTSNSQLPTLSRRSRPFGSWELGVPWKLELGSWELTPSRRPTFAA